MPPASISKDALEGLPAADPPTAAHQDGIHQATPVLTPLVLPTLRKPEALPTVGYVPVAPRWNPDAPPAARSRGPARPKTSPRGLTGQAARTVSLIVERLGAVSLDTAVRLGGLLNDQGWRYYYTAADRLVAAGVLARYGVRELGVAKDRQRVAKPRRQSTTLRAVLVPGPAWTDWMGRIGVGPAPIPARPSRVALVEQLVLGAEIVRRVLAGWRFAEGAEWLNAAVALDHGRAVGRRADRLARIETHGGLRFPEGVRAAGLLPPDRSGFACFLVGGRWSPTIHLAEQLTSVARVAPVEIVCWRRSDTFVNNLRAIVGRRVARQTAGKIAVLPPPSRGDWAVFWQDLADAVRVGGDAAMRARLDAFFRQSDADLSNRC